MSPHFSRQAATALLAWSVLAGCVGSVPRAEFDDDLRARGGGITDETMLQALELTAAEVAVADTDDLEVLDIRADATNRSIVVQARRGDRDDFVDVVVVRDDDIASVTPVQDADQLDLDQMVVSVAELPIDRTEELIDAAITTFGDPDTLLTSYTVRVVAGVAEIAVEVESSRRTGDVVFDLDGTVRTEPS